LFFLFRNQEQHTMQSKTNTVSRRSVIQGAGALGAASLAGSLFPGIAVAQGTAPETRAAKLGFIALTDAAPLFVADEKGFFRKHGMTEVEVLKQSSWGTTRDNLVLGSRNNGIDGAHILTPMPYLITTGAVTANNVQVPINILARLNLGGQGISVGEEYRDLKVGLDTRGFAKALLAKRQKTGKPVNAAMTFPGGTHDLWIRYWMAAGGVDPNKDITTIVVPPAQMVANMKVGSMDTFCVCEPWNMQLIHQKIGYTALTTSELWMNHPTTCRPIRTRPRRC
jgi:nitrate/nitrite transport system substrate-binding protein